jgi:hypothetical protein
LEYLSSHIHHCFEEKRATCEIGVVTLLGVMERVESVSEKARKVFVMPIAIW